MIVWLQLPGLPIHFYHKEVLISIGNLVGRTIKLDYHTLNQQRAKFARLAVEIDLEKPLVPRIHLDGEWQKIEYENLPEVCFECGKVGHSSVSCPQIRSVSQTGALTVAGLLGADSSDATTVEEPSASFGPWMIVTKKSRRNIRDQNRKGKEDSEEGKLIQGNGSKNGRMNSAKKEGGDGVGRLSHIPQASQRTNTAESKNVTVGRTKDEIRKGKEKIGMTSPTAAKGLLGPGPSLPNGPGPKPLSSPTEASSSHACREVSTTHGPVHQTNGPIQPELAVPIQSLIGPNGTEMQIISAQQPCFKPLSETSPKRPDLGRKQKQEKSSKSRSRKFSPVKQNPLKPLQIWSPMKEKKSKTKSRLATLTLEEINDWTKGGKEAASMDLKKVALPGATALGATVSENQAAPPPT
ncbi:unnamed protein product [Linum tenue]|uniref:CCHC-type domain-containing protein n=1 Tax=Linum tenue TaxID=586396 RepID=A0AAV0RG38_9ROSI|nr:unnamed protein product [Linum tenue]